MTDVQMDVWTYRQKYEWMHRGTDRYKDVPWMSQGQTYVPTDMAGCMDILTDVWMHKVTDVGTDSYMDA